MRSAIENKKEALKKIEAFKGIKVAVIGDIIVDEYLIGTTERISPEAPVPVVDVKERVIKPGGAANVALNLKEAGAETHLFGVIGKDAIGKELLSILREKGIECKGIIVSEERPTTLKTRVISMNQQVVRVDREKRAPIGPDVIEKLKEVIKRGTQNFDIAIFEDYNKGVLHRESIRSFRKTLKNRPIIVDPKFDNFKEYSGVFLLKPNLKELSGFIKSKIKDDSEIIKGVIETIEKLKPENFVVTLGEKGMICVNHEEKSLWHIPALKLEVFDVTGAGDTVAAFLALALAAGFSLKGACLIASIAAGIEVGKFGASQVKLEELKEKIRDSWDFLKSKIKGV